MKSYPSTITNEILASLAHLSDEAVARDIADTEHEVAQYERLRAAEEEVAAVHPHPGERRMAAFRASARPLQIDERRAFIAYLGRIQAARAAAKGEG